VGLYFTENKRDDQSADRRACVYLDSHYMVFLSCGAIPAILSARKSVSILRLSSRCILQLTDDFQQMVELTFAVNKVIEPE
jgi:hypothetical protein